MQKSEENPDLAPLCDHLRGNVGFVFTKSNLKDVRDGILKNKVPAPARAGAVAQCGVTIPSGLTGMEPTQTSFFQALNCCQLNFLIIRFIWWGHMGFLPLPIAWR